MSKRDMNAEISKYPIYRIIKGKIERYTEIESTKDYNHCTMHLHHFVKDFEKNRHWYEMHRVEQKLFLIPIEMHEQVHNNGIKPMTDEEFKNTYGISRWELVFNRKHSCYL